MAAAGVDANYMIYAATDVLSTIPLFSDSANNDFSILLCQEQFRTFWNLAKIQAFENSAFPLYIISC